MQKQMVRTTITVPQNLLQAIKAKAASSNKTVSEIIVKATAKEFNEVNIPALDPLKMLGKYKLRIKKGETFRREDMYDEYLKHKVPF